jgi:hypothetical protein
MTFSDCLNLRAPVRRCAPSACSIVLSVRTSGAVSAPDGGDGRRRAFFPSGLDSSTRCTAISRRWRALRPGYVSDDQRTDGASATSRSADAAGLKGARSGRVRAISAYKNPRADRGLARGTPVVR